MDEYTQDWINFLEEADVMQEWRVTIAESFVTSGLSLKMACDRYKHSAIELDQLVNEQLLSVLRENQVVKNNIKRAIVRKIQKKCTRKTLLAVLHEWYIGTPNTPRNVYLYRYPTDNMPSSLHYPDSEFNRQPMNVTLIQWEDFDQHFRNFFDHDNPNQVLKTSIPIERLPNVDSELTMMNTEANMCSFLIPPLKQIVKPFIPNSRGYEIIEKYPSSFGIQDIAIVAELVDLKLIIECRLSPRFAISLVAELIHIFRTQNSNDSSNAPSRQINQIVNYLLLNKARYAILTTLKHSFAFERVSDTVIRVAPVKNDDQLLRLVFYLLYQTTLPGHREHSALQRSVVLPISNAILSQKMILEQIPREADLPDYHIHELFVQVFLFI